MTVTSWQIKLVVARSMTEAHAASANQRNFGCSFVVFFLRFWVTISTGTSMCRIWRTAQIPAVVRKARYPAAHTQACTVNVIDLSTTKGQDNSPSIDPRFDKAYSRYGIAKWL